MTVILMTGTAAACSTSSGTASSAGDGPELTNITVDALEIPDAIPIVIAQKDGFFKQEGLNVKIQPIAAADDIVPQLLAHTVQFTVEDYVGMFAEQAQTPALGFRVISDDSQAAPNTFDLVVPKGSPITSVADLKGKTIAIPGLGTSIATLSMDALLHSYGLSTSSYKAVAVAFPDMPAEMAQGKFDAAWVTEPFVTIMEAAGAHVLTDVMTGALENFPVSAWATTAYIEQHDPKTVAAFQKAIVKGQQVAASNPSLVRQLLPGFIQGLTAQVANVMTLPTYNTTVSLTRMDRVVDVMQQYDMLPKNFDVNSMLLSSTSGS